MCLLCEQPPICALCTTCAIPLKSEAGGHPPMCSAVLHHLPFSVRHLPLCYKLLLKTRLHGSRWKDILQYKSHFLKYMKCKQSTNSIISLSALDRSQSLFYFVPQENLTDKLARLFQSPSSLLALAQNQAELQDDILQTKVHLLCYQLNSEFENVDSQLIADSCPSVSVSAAKSLPHLGDLARKLGASCGKCKG